MIAGVEQPKIYNMAQRAWIKSASRYSSRVVGSIPKSAVPHP